MTYKLKAKHQKFPVGYWEQRKIDEYAKSRGKKTFWKASKIATENLTEATQRTHTEGKFIMYKKEKPAIVRRVTKRGVWLEEFEIKGDKGVIDPETKSKIFFVPEKEYEKHAEPYFIKNPIYSTPLPFVYFK
jgi:hypothetical protein